MRRTQIYLDEEQKRALRAIAADRDLNVSDLVRKAIDRLLRDELDLADWGGRFDALQRRLRTEIDHEPTDQEIASAVKAARIDMKRGHSRR